MRGADVTLAQERLSIKDMKAIIEHNGMFGEYAITILDLNEGMTVVWKKTNPIW